MWLYDFRELAYVSSAEAAVRPPERAAQPAVSPPLWGLPPSLYLSHSSLRSRIPSRNPSEMLQEKLVNDEATSLEVKRLPPLY